jgi:DNA-directed RNA polymerase sigma subunit (sigma70/sigma32)
MGVTRERVRQIEAQALRRLRSTKIQRELRAYTE